MGSAWTRPLQIATVVCSIVFTLGTAVQNFVIIDLDMLVHAMRLAGVSEADAPLRAQGFLVGLRTVGCVYIVGNALGILALSGRVWLYWAVLAVNLTQALGVVVIPPVVFQASVAQHGALGALPSLITDGGAALLTLLLLGCLLVFRTPWAYVTARRSRPAADIMAGCQRD